MGRVTVTLKLANRGAAAEPREIEVEALVDSGATLLCLKPSVIAALGLQRFDTVPMRTANGTRDAKKYGPVWLEVMGRGAYFNALELSEENPNLLGQIPLEELDLVVDCKSQRLVGNPAHGGTQTVEVY